METKTEKDASASKQKMNPLDILYSPGEFNLTTASQPNCKLTEFEKSKQKINIKIENAKLEKQGFLFGMKFSSDLICEELNSKVNRTYEDFEWLKIQFNDKYPFIFVPPLPSKLKSESPELYVRYLNKFLKSVLRKKILRTSELLENFLTLDEKAFLKYKETNNKLIGTDITMEKYRTMKENYKVDFKKEQLSLPEKYLKRYEPAGNLYLNVKKNLELIVNDFANLNKHLKELSNDFANLQKNARDTDQDESIKNTYDKLKNIFNNWSLSSAKQKDFFEKDFSEFFSYIRLELNELNTLQKQYMTVKKNYETKGIEYLNKRDKLFNSKNYAKWELKEEDAKKLDEFKNNYDEAIKYICKDTKDSLEKQKNVVVSGCNIIMREFGRVSKYLGEQMKEYFEKIKEKNQEMLSDCYNVIKLLDVTVGN